MSPISFQSKVLHIPTVQLLECNNKHSVIYGIYDKRIIISLEIDSDCTRVWREYVKEGGTAFVLTEQSSNSATIAFFKGEFLVFTDVILLFL